MSSTSDASAERAKEWADEAIKQIEACAPEDRYVALFVLFSAAKDQAFMSGYCNGLRTAADKCRDLNLAVQAKGVFYNSDTLPYHRCELEIRALIPVSP